MKAKSDITLTYFVELFLYSRIRSSSFPTFDYYFVLLMSSCMIARVMVYIFTYSLYVIVTKLGTTMNISAGSMWNTTNQTSEKGKLNLSDRKTCNIYIIIVSREKRLLFWNRARKLLLSICFHSQISTYWTCLDPAVCL